MTNGITEIKKKKKVEPTIVFHHHEPLSFSPPKDLKLFDAKSDWCERLGG